MRWDSPWTGLVTGLLMPVLGFFLYGLIHTTLVRPHLDMHYFVYDLFLSTRRFQAPLITLGLIANLPLFFLFDHWDLQKAMRGVITATFLYGIVIVVLWM